MSIAQRYDTVRQSAHQVPAKGRGLGAHVVSVAFGAREKKGSGRPSRRAELVANEPCLVVVVEKKQPKSRLSRDARIPSHVVIKVKVGKGRKRAVAIPTDVVSRRRTPMAQAIRGLQVENFERLRVFGSVAALVREKPDSGLRFYLTCHHVACLSNKDPQLNSRLPADVFALQEYALIGDEVVEGFFGAGIGPCVDAALVKIEEEAEITDFEPTFRATSAIRTAGELNAEAATGAFLFSFHHPEGVQVTLRRVHSQFPIRYQSGATAEMVEAMEYRFHLGASRGGDSGGAIVSSSGVFLGMHIAGSGMTGFGIPAYLLFDSPAFQPPIELA
jgi:hypothetical protein